MYSNIYGDVVAESEEIEKLDGIVFYSRKNKIKASLYAAANSAWKMMRLYNPDRDLRFHSITVVYDDNKFTLYGGWMRDGRIDPDLNQVIELNELII